jgi:hypothetical protein
MFYLRLRQWLVARVTNLRRKKLRTTCLGFTPSLPLGTEASNWSLRVQWDILKGMFNTST